MRRLGVVAAATLLMATAAVADGYKSPHRGHAPYAPVFTWSGLYVGTNIGYGWGDNDPVGLRLDDPGNPPLGNRIGTLPADGFFAGGQVGFNVQLGLFVFGTELDVQAADISAGFGPDVVGGAIPGTFRGDSTIEFFGTLRGRVGLAFDRMLIYATGGYAWANVDYNVSGVGPGGVNFAVRENTSFSGFALGGGLEWAVTPTWSVKAEYQWINFGREDFTTQVLTAAGVPTGQTMTTAATPEIHTFRIGVNYRLTDHHFDAALK